jgi:hypothetical protein
MTTDLMLRGFVYGCVAGLGFWALVAAGLAARAVARGLARIWGSSSTWRPLS